MSLITLTTDFGTREGYPAAMKGVIYNIAPEAKIVDITHNIQPQNIYEAAFILEINVFYFPKDTVHIVVVDPGVGTARRPIAGRIGSQRFVAPDNGVLTRLLLRAERENWPVEFVHIDRPKYWLADLSSTFHGRDLFAPVGAQLTNDVTLAELGTPITSLERLRMAQPQETAEGVTGEVIHIDHFGNAITNITAQDISHLGEVQVSLCGKTVSGLVRTFSEHPAGTLLALWDSSKYLMVSEYGGLKQIQPKLGNPVQVRSISAG
jgi:hypothetical protein